MRQRRGDVVFNPQRRPHLVNVIGPPLHMQGGLTLLGGHIVPAAEAVRCELWLDRHLDVILNGLIVAQAVLYPAVADLLVVGLLVKNTVGL